MLIFVMWVDIQCSRVFEVLIIMRFSVVLSVCGVDGHSV